VNQPKDVVQNLRVVRILLELDQLIVNRVQALVGFRQKLAQKIVHDGGLSGISRIRPAAVTRP
jgi:hypothetical protein